MKRIEIITNKSIEEDILQGLETCIKDFSYTIIPVVHGKGKDNYRLGTSIWPEENCIIFTYLEDDTVPAVEQTVNEVKTKHPGEGIKLFIVPVS
jgi:nitrogen regulatory protein PII